MASTFPFHLHLVIFFTLFLFGSVRISSSADDLSTTHYNIASCPDVLSIVKTVVQASISKEGRMGASLLRLHFHDCFVNGCDASLLLDDVNGEKEAAPNKNSARGFEIIDQIKEVIEERCPGIVSCADILTIAARDSVFLLGGPHWEVKLGRRDSLTGSKDAAEQNLPGPTSNLDELVLNFEKHGLSENDLVVLSGAHTIGHASCATFRSRIYNETNIDRNLARTRQGNCPRPSGIGDKNIAPLDIQSPTTFENNYYKNLINQSALLHSDQVLFNGGSTDSLVRTYSNDLSTFHAEFAAAMIKMGDIRPLTGSNGEIRRNCRRTN